MAKKVLKAQKSAPKAAAKKTAKSAPKKSVTKTSAKGSVGKKAVAKPVAKPAAKKPPVKKAPVKKPVAQAVKAAKKAPVKKTVAKPVAKKVVQKAAPKKVVKAAPPKGVKKPVAKPVARVVAKRPAKAVRLNPVAEPAALPIDWTEDKLKTVKTGLNKKDFQAFRELLLEHRMEIVGDVQSMEEARNVSAGDLSHMPLHMADVGSDNYDQEFTIGIMESERKILREIDEALARMDRGIYGVCLETGQAIDRNRLEAVPWTKYSKEAALRREKQAG